MTDAEIIGRSMAVKDYQKVARFLLDYLDGKDSIDIQEAFSNALWKTQLRRRAVEGVLTWASRIALEKNKVLVVYPEVYITNHDFDPNITITGIRLKLAETWCETGFAEE